MGDGKTSSGKGGELPGGRSTETARDDGDRLPPTKPPYEEGPVLHQRSRRQEQVQGSREAPGRKRAKKIKKTMRQLEGTDPWVKYGNTYFSRGRRIWQGSKAKQEKDQPHGEKWKHARRGGGKQAQKDIVTTRGQENKGIAWKKRRKDLYAKRKGGKCLSTRKESLPLPCWKRKG